MNQIPKPGTAVGWSSPFRGWTQGVFLGLAPGDNGVGDAFVRVNTKIAGVVTVRLSALEPLPAAAAILTRKAVNGSVPKLTDAQVALVKAAFRDNPEWAHCYLAWGDKVYGPDFMVGASRTAQLNSIARDGFPAIVGRKHSQIEEADAN